MGKRKCYIVSYYGVSNMGGVERVCYYVKRILAEKGYDVIIVDKDVIENFWMGHIVRLLLGRVPLLCACVLASAYVTLKKRKHDIVIANGFNCPLAAVDLLFIHGTMKGHKMAIGVKDTFKSSLPIRFEKVASDRAKNIISVSHLAVDEVKRFYGHKKDNFFVLNNMVDDSNYYPLQKEKSKQLSIIFCGRMEKRKGADRLLQMAKYIDSNHVNARLIIATNCSNPQVVELSKHECADIMVGLSPEQLNNFYNKGDVMYFPSMYEGFEMVTLESLSAGVPVLGNHVGAVAELYDRKEPGVDLIKDNASVPEILSLLEQLADSYSSFEEKKRLHDYYAERYGTEAYMNKLNLIFKEIS